MVPQLTTNGRGETGRGAGAPLIRLLAWLIALAIAIGGASAFGPASLASAETVATTGDGQLSPHAGTVDGMVLDAHGGAIVNDLTRTEIAPGLTHYTFTRLNADGRQPINILKAQLGADTVELKYLHPDTVSGAGATVTQMTDAAGAVGGVNLDHFDINNSNASGGWGVEDGKILKTGDPGENEVLGMGDDGLAKLVSLTLNGSAVFDGGASVGIARINTATSTAGDVVLYNSVWGAYDRAAVLGGAAGVEVIVGADGTVASVGQPGSGQLDSGQQALVATADSENGRTLAAATAGQSVDISYDFDTSLGDVKEAGGIWHELIRDGQVIPHSTDSFFTGRNPRTMLGLSDGGQTVYFVVADGRTSSAVGMTFDEEIQLMQDLGATDAVNVDGGGSSQMNVREPGDATSSVQNQPSDGFERHDGDGMGLVLSQSGSGTATGVAVAPTSSAQDAERVFPGLHRPFAAKPYDETSSAVAAPVSWTAGDGRISVSGDTAGTATVTGLTSGGSSVLASAGQATGTAGVQVLGALDRLTASTSLVSLDGAGGTAGLTLLGYDANGFSAPIDAQDVVVSGNDGALVRTDADADGTFTITGVQDEGGEVLHFDVQGRSADVVVTIGLRSEAITDLSDAASWTSANDRAPGGSVSATTGANGENALHMTYDFTQSTATRGQYAVAPGSGIEIAGQPQKIRLNVNGDGLGSWIRLQLKDGVGATQTFSGPYITWTGWQTVDIDVPAGTKYPLTLNRVRLLETTGAKQYTGQVDVSGLAALVAQDVNAPAVAPVVDSGVVAATGSADARPQRIAIFSDAQFVARNPDSDQANGARRALREIVAAQPDALFIVGDLVDEGSAADFDLARQILDAGLADATFPWYYVPGNHEVMGSSIQNFEDAQLGGFAGAPSGHVDIAGTRFIALNTADGTLSSDFSQLQMLRQQLDDAATNPDVTGVVLVQHMPIDDPNVNKQSQLGNRLDANMERDWMEEFRATSGKSLAMVNGHVGNFSAKRDDGIPYVINGNSGKNPTQVDQGAFLGWTMLGIDADEGVWQANGKGVIEENTDWFIAETHVWAESVTLDGISETLPAGTQRTLTGTVQQNATTSAPLAWPMSVEVTGSAGVFVGELADAPATAIAAVDPATLQLTALHAGSGTVTVSVGDASATQSFTVSGGDATVTGDAEVGSILTAQLGDWAQGRQVSYQWLRDGEAIADATSATYELTPSDAHRTVSVRTKVSADERGDVVTEVAAGSDVAPTTPAVSVSAEALSQDGLPHVVATLTYGQGRTAVSPAGKIQFLQDGQPVGDPIPVDAGGVATFVPSAALGDGSYAFSAEYMSAGAADAFLDSSVSPSVTVTVAVPQDTTTTLSADPVSVAEGDSVTLTATVAPVATGTGASIEVPTFAATALALRDAPQVTAPALAGTVEFFNGTTSLGTASLNADTGVAQLSTTALPVGEASLTAVFTAADPAAFNPSTSAAVSVTVAAAAEPAPAPVELNGGCNSVPLGGEVECDEPAEVAGYESRAITREPEQGKAWLASVHYAAQDAAPGEYPFDVAYTMKDGKRYVVTYTPVVREAGSGTTLSQTGTGDGFVAGLALIAALLLAAGSGLTAARRRARARRP